MNRKEQIENAAEEEKDSAYRWHSNYEGNKSLYDYSYGVLVGFNRGAEWADDHPQILPGHYQIPQNQYLSRIEELNIQCYRQERQLTIATEALKKYVESSIGATAAHALMEIEEIK